MRLHNDYSAKKFVIKKSLLQFEYLRSQSEWLRTAVIADFRLEVEMT